MVGGRGRSAGTALQPRCITRTTKVDVVPFEDVTADCAAAEGDGTLAAWKKAHRKAFSAACEEIGRNFDESMKCVCEYLMWFTGQMGSEINRNFPLFRHTNC